MARIDNLQNFIEDVGQAIKDKKGIPEEQKIQVRNFDTEIMSIETGGGGGGDRPNYWLPMPSDEEVLDNEIYMLVDIPNTDEVLFTFRATFTGDAFIDTGDGTVFPLTSGTKFEYAFNFDNITNTVNVEGHKQVLVKVYGGVFNYIHLYEAHSKKPSNYQHSIVDIKMRATECFSLNVSGSGSTQQVNRKLKYFNYLGTNKITNMSNMFYNCSSLTSIPNLDTSNVTNMSFMFQNCSSLTSIPSLDTSNVTNIGSMFSGCSSLTSIPSLDTSNVTNMFDTFKNCYSLISLSQLDISKVTNVGSGTYNATFNNNYSLANLSILGSLGDPTTVLTFYLQNTNLSRNKLVELATNLPITSVDKTININRTLGTQDLTEDDKAIFTDKGYILVV